MDAVVLRVQFDALNKTLIVAARVLLVSSAERAVTTVGSAPISVERVMAIQETEDANCPTAEGGSSRRRRRCLLIRLVNGKLKNDKEAAPSCAVLNSVNMNKSSVWWQKCLMNGARVPIPHWSRRTFFRGKNRFRACCFGELSLLLMLLLQFCQIE